MNLVASPLIKYGIKGIVPISDSPIKLKSSFLQYAELPSPAKRYKASLESEVIYSNNAFNSLTKNRTQDIKRKSLIVPEYSGYLS